MILGWLKKAVDIHTMSTVQSPKRRCRRVITWNQIHEILLSGKKQIITEDIQFHPICCEKLYVQGKNLLRA